MNLRAHPRDVGGEVARGTVSATSQRERGRREQALGARNPASQRQGPPVDAAWGEAQGEAPGRDVEDWCEAAAAIDRLLEAMRKAGVTRVDYERVGLRNALRLWTD